MEIINVTDEIIEVNVTEEVITIQAPTGAYPLPNAVNSVFGRVGSIVASEGDYTLTQLGDVTLTSPANGQVLKYNGTTWVNDSDSGITGTGTTNTLPKFTGASTIGNSNISDSGTLITLGSNTTISSGGLGIGTSSLTGFSLNVGKNITGAVSSNGVAQQGVVQSDVTSSAFGFLNQINTQAASFTLGAYYHFTAGQLTIGAGSSVTTQIGFEVTAGLIGATNNFGFRGLIPAGANRWNIYMLGTANNYMAGSLGIGTTSLTASSLAIAKNITGAATMLVVSQAGTVQSDANTNVIAFNNQINTQATSFALTQYIHYNATQGTIGAGSSVTTQIGFNVSPSMIGGTNNYGFRSGIPVGAGRWNLFIDGTAANFLAGDTGIGTQSLGTATMLTIGGTETAVSAISRGQLINTTLVASANSDNLIGLDIAPTFTNGAFTGVRNIALRSSGDIQVANNANINGLKTNGQPFVLVKMDSTDSVVVGNNQSATQLLGVGIEFRTGAGLGAKLFNTNNLVIQNAGTYVDAGFRLDVNGTTRFIGTASSDTAPLGSELAAVTGTGTNWTLAGTNLNVGGYTHTTGSVVPLTTALAAVSGTYYQIAYTITGRTTGSITIDYGGTSTSGITATGNTGPLASSTAVLTITPTTDFNGTVVLSIKTISASAASSTFANSTLASNIEFRASNITSNSFIGLNAGRRNTTGNNNTFVGSQAGINNTTGNFNTFLGVGAGVNNTTANQNTFLGMNTGNANTIGGSNTFIGAFSGQANTSGANNTFVGLISGAANTTGTSNTFIGREAGTKNTSGNNNTFVGLSAGQENTTGTGNVVVGVTSAQLNTTGNDNSVVGYLALNANVGGSFNLAFGRDAGRYIANKSTSATVLNNSIMIGYRTSPLADSQTNQIVIGHDAIGLGSNTTVIGNSSTTLTALYGDLVLGSTTPVASALLTMNSTTEGFLPPRMTTTQKNAISSPATGLVVFDTTLGKLCVFAGTWQTITSA